MADTEVIWDAWMKLAEVGQYADAMEGYIREYDHVSLVELQRRFAPYMDTKGHIAIHLPDDPNIVHWVGMSQGFADAVVELLESKRIEPEAAPVLVYMIDGGLLKYPVVKRIGKTPRKKVGWLPIALRIRSEPRRKGRLPATATAARPAGSVS